MVNGAAGPAEDVLDLGSFVCVVHLVELDVHCCLPGFEVVRTGEDNGVVEGMLWAAGWRWQVWWGGLAVDGEGCAGGVAAWGAHCGGLGECLELCLELFDAVS